MNSPSPTSDIDIGIALILAISAIVFATAVRITRRATWTGAALLALVAVVFLVLFNWLLWDSLLLARLLPFSNLIVTGNWQPPIVAALAGVAWGSLPGRVWRRGILIVPLLLAGMFKWTAPLLADPPPTEDRWSDGACLQTSLATCSPAAAATVLRAHGIDDVTESELARLCLTGPNGTTMHGLFRGLKLKTAGTQWDVEPFTGSDLRRLRAATRYGPVILAVRLETGAAVDPRYEKEWDWIPGVTHTIVLFGFAADGKVNIADPSVGREQWFVQDLRVLWHGEGLRLVPRDRF
jgi:hypothetical protein